MDQAQLLYALCFLSLSLVYVRAQTCKKPADVAVLLDASGSIGRRKWPLVAGFTKSLVNSFGISEEGSHIAVVMYATKTKVVVGFNDFVGADRTPANINAKIDAIDYNDWKGMTYIDRGLDTANKFVFTEAAGMRPDKKKVLILFTDGKQTKTQEPFTELDIAAQPLKDKGVEVHAIGIGKSHKIDVDELGTMATKRSYVYTAESFDELVPMALRILESSCDIPIKRTSRSYTQEEQRKAIQRDPDMKSSLLYCGILCSLFVLQVQASCKSLPAMHGVAMTGSVVKAYKVPTLYDCYSECKDSNYTTKCRSINYFSQTSLCHHNGLKILDKPEDKMKHSDSIYVDNPDAVGNVTKPTKEWVLIARFSNIDTKNWMETNGAWWYDITTEQGDSTSTVVNQDMITPAFWTTKGREIKITRTDDPYHTPLLVTTSNCLGDMTFREKISSFGNFRNGAIWSSDKCLGKCTVTYGGQYASTAGFSKTSCDSNVLTRNQIGFWCDYDGGAGAVFSIGGAGSACDRADHGLGVTEENAGKLGTSIGCDFGDNGQSSCVMPSYALNLWIQ